MRLADHPESSRLGAMCITETVKRSIEQPPSQMSIAPTIVPPYLGRGPVDEDGKPVVPVAHAKEKLQLHCSLEIRTAIGKMDRYV